MNKKILVLFGALLLFANAVAFGAPEPTAKDYPASEPIEHFFARQHAAVTRIILIYDEILKRLKNNETYPPEALSQTAIISRTFMQDYHEKLEEGLIFPRFDKAYRHVDLVHVLKRQHELGNQALNTLLADIELGSPDKTKIADSIKTIIQLYSPHKDREDVVLLTDLKTILTPGEYEEVWQELQKKEKEHFGEHGFKNLEDKIEEIETSLGIEP